jgi:Fe-S cluster biogenesis protein NfuA
MFIETEQTPNPATLKFLPGRAVMAAGTANYADAVDTENSPLARRLFAVPGVTGVFLGADFVSVSKDESLDWYRLKPAVLGVIMEHFTSGEPVFLGEAATDDDADDDEIVSQIKELLETRVRPAVAQDGGDILFNKFDPDTGVVWLHMRGACSGCPSSAATLKAGVENMLRHYVPEVTRVEQTL